MLQKKVPLFNFTSLFYNLFIISTTERAPFFRGSFLFFMQVISWGKNKFRIFFDYILCFLYSYDIIDIVYGQIDFTGCFSLS